MESNEKRDSILNLIPVDDKTDMLDQAVTSLLEAEESEKGKEDQPHRTKRAKPSSKTRVDPGVVTVEDVLPTKPSQSVAVQQAVEVLSTKEPAKPKSLATSREGVARLMTALNIDLDLQLTKNDTATLLSCLLTANETQLLALANNKKIPVAIKTVIKRILDDSKTGNMETIERMWDRLFGKAPMTESVTTQVPGMPSGPSIIPNGPVSRETYIFIKEQLMGS